jgi:hypothetical protein
MRELITQLILSMLLLITGFILCSIDSIRRESETTLWGG